MIKSLRWRLQIWYSLVMILVVTAFAVSLYQRIRTKTIAGIDQQLEGGARFLEATLRKIPTPVLDHRGPRGGGQRPPPGNRPPPRETEFDPYDELFGPLPGERPSR